MKKITTNKILIMALITLVAFTNANSQSVDSSFTYQGELLENGAPANGQYDINIDLIDGDMFPWGSTSVHSPVEVVNGVFSVNADFGISAYDGYKDVTVTVSVRKTSEGPGGVFTTLGSQTIQAVPLATSLTNGNATTGQVFTFNGFQWGPATPTQSPWTIAASSLTYMGKVGLGTSSPLADFHIDATTDGDIVRVRIGAITKFYVDDNGGTGVGAWTTPPVDGLRVEGDVKQSINSNGMMKYMVSANCTTSNSSIIRSYNGVSSSPITVTNGASGDVQCVINFPNDIDNRFWQVSPDVATKDRGANCTLNGTSKLNCYRYTGSTGSNNGGKIMVLVY